MTFFINAFDTQNKRALIQWARDDFDSYDQWGWIMSWMFDICSELWNRGEIDATRLVQYRPGAYGAEVSEDRAEGLAQISTESLIWTLKVFNRFEERLRANGESY
jgi:hypothetical protein